MPTKRGYGYGQVIERGENTFLVRVSLGKDFDGKRKFYNKTNRGTKFDAERHLHEYLHKKSLGLTIAATKVTFEAFMEDWFENVCRHRVRPNTFKHYRYQVETYAYPALGGKRLQQVTALDLERLYKALLKSPNSPEPGKICADGIRHFNSVIRSAFKHAISLNLTAKNPAVGLSLPRPQRREIRTLTAEEARRFLDTVKGHRWGVVYKFALVTDMRPEEYMGLRWDDVHLSPDGSSGYVSVHRALVWQRGGGWTIEEPKTPKSRRMMPLPVSLAADLRAHRERQEQQKQQLGARWKPGNWVFTSVDGRPLNLRKLAYYYKLLLIAAGLPREMRLYDLRHSCAALLLTQGINPKIVSERLGHASIVLTLDTYSHVLPTMQNAANEALDAVLSGDGSCSAAVSPPSTSAPSAPLISGMEFVN